jgi:hypothetical protein
LQNARGWRDCPLCGSDFFDANVADGWGLNSRSGELGAWNPSSELMMLVSWRSSTTVPGTSSRSNTSSEAFAREILADAVKSIAKASHDEILNLRWPSQLSIH